MSDRPDGKSGKMSASGARGMGLNSNPEPRSLGTVHSWHPNWY